MFEKPSYEHFVKARSLVNPCLTDLVKYLKGVSESGQKLTIITLEYSHGSQSQLQPLVVGETDLIRLLDTTTTTTTTTAVTCGRVLIVENIRPSLISLLGEILDVDPIFFAGHVTTSFQDIEQAPPPPSLALFPSYIAERGYLHMHYQHVVDLGDADSFIDSPYALKTDSHIPRNVRRLPRLSGRQLALVRACCSVMTKRLGNSWICLILVDPPIKSVIEPLKSGLRKAYPSKPLQGGFEDFLQSPSFASFRVTAPHTRHSWDKASMLSSLLHYFGNPPPGFTTTQPSILSLGYYPMRIILAEWMIYVHLMSRYFKYYEYSLRDGKTRLHDNDIVDLQRWRRRTTQSQHKLKILTDYIRHWMPWESDRLLWDMTVKDIGHIMSQLEHYGDSLEQMIPVATSMVQLLDSRRSTLEAANVGRLTYIALVFVPLSWVASLFSMSDEYSPGHHYFWVYIATALPVMILVLFLSVLHWDELIEKAKGSWKFRKRLGRGQVAGVGLPQ
ncbi:hypothetical protein S40293_10061 [Stachybotrys chartarum IBT 40293]|nr:hypothetical protein S40293_10061 [Stachybotrys chartarum IBT 40293]